MLSNFDENEKKNFNNAYLFGSIAGVVIEQALVDSATGGAAPGAKALKGIKYTSTALAKGGKAAIKAIKAGKALAVGTRIFNTGEKIVFSKRALNLPASAASKTTPARVVHTLERHVGLDLDGRPIPIVIPSRTRFTNIFPMGQTVTIDGRTITMQKLMNLDELLPAMKETWDGGVAKPGIASYKIEVTKKLQKQQIVTTYVHDLKEKEMVTFIPMEGPGVVRWDADLRKIQEWRPNISPNGDNWFDI